MKTFADFSIEIPSGAHGEIDVLCPQCSGQRKKSRVRDLSVNVEKGIWLCAHCGWKGGLGSAIERHEPAPKTFKPPRPVPVVIAPSLSEVMEMWFAGRGINKTVMNRNGVTAAVEWCSRCNERKTHFLYPMLRDGQHVNTKHRCIDKHFRMESEAERILYGIDDLDGEEVCIWVEGEMDKLAVEMAGFTNCVSVPDGGVDPNASNYATKFDYLKSAETVLSKIKRHIMICDEDAKGYGLTEELCRRLGREKCWRGTFPEGIKDANECLMKIGAEELRRVIEASEPYPIDGVVTMDDIATDLHDLYENGFDEGVRIGWPQLDQHYRVRPGLMTIVTGIPSHGKSGWIDQFVVELIAQHGWPVAFYSPENYPPHRHAAGLVAKYIGKPFARGWRERMTNEELERTRRFFLDHLMMIDMENPSIDALLTTAKQLVYQRGIKGLVIDPWNEIDHDRPHHMTETEYISLALGRIRRFARVNGVHVWIVAHPTKLKKELDGSEAKPTLYDISGSSHFRNKADYGITVWRDIADPATANEVAITKVRFQETGRIGKVEFWYDIPTGTYREDRARAITTR